MIGLDYSLVIEATEQPDFFGFYSPDLQGFTGIGHSVEDCLYQARWGMREHVALLKEMGLPVPAKKLNPQVVIQNDERLQARQAIPRISKCDAARQMESCRLNLKRPRRA